MKRESDNFKNLEILRQGRPESINVPGIEIREGETFDSINYSSRMQRNVLMLEKALQPNKPNSNQEFLLSLIDRKVRIEQMSIEILDASRNVTAVIVFHQCIVVSYQLSDLNAIDSGYIKQTIGIKYQSAVIQQST